MECCDVPQNSSYGLSSVSERKSNILCPKPRRLGRLMVAEIPLRFHISHHEDLHDSTACAEILDIILTRDNYGSLDQFSGSQISSSPPYFCGSPPSRAANPLVHDACFMEEITNKSSLTPSQFSSPRKGGGCVRLSTKFGPQPAAVRVEGFDCLNGDSRGCGIPALA